MDERSKRINDAIAQSGYSYPELSKITGVSKSSLQRYATGGTKKIPIDCVEAIAKATGTSAKYLMGWEDDKTDPLDDLDDLASKYSNIKCIQKKKFPLLGEIACGEPIYADEDKESFIMADMDIDADFCLTAKGDSMINARFVDFDTVKTEMEDRADSFARDTLLDTDSYMALIKSGRYHDLNEIKRFSASVGVPHWVVIGRLHSDEWLDWSYFAHETPKFEWED